MGSRRAGRGFKRFLEAVGFILAKFELKRSHRDPVHLPMTSFARLRESRGGDSRLAQGVLVLTVSLRGSLEE